MDWITNKICRPCSSGQARTVRMITSHFKWNDNSVLELSKAFKAYIYYRNYRQNLITGFPESYKLEQVLNKLNEVQLQANTERPTVYHFYYELGLIFMGLGHSVDEDAPLLIELEYESKKLKEFKNSPIKKLPLKSLERPTWSEYKDAFAKVQEYLLNGDCYQVNLTYPFDFVTEEVFDPRDLTTYFFSRKNVSAFAHSTFLGDELILSNSPECLFKYQGHKMIAMPIKGTIRAEKNWKDQWHKLLSSPKEEGELNMITDLLRNDLNRLEKPIAQVQKLRAPLKVEGLLHQYSLISLNLDNSISLLRTMESLFPGGSVTGAPKKRVMQIIQDVERYTRGIYCGSTLLCMGDKKIASINIRTASISIGDRIWKYGAGGGVTLLSKPNAEFAEMEDKVASFLTLLGVPGYQSLKP